MILMYKIAVIGSHSAVNGFRALGLDAFPAETGEEARKILKKISSQELESENSVVYAIIYIEETLAQEFMDEIRKYDKKPCPAVILIPGRDGAIGIGQTALHEAVLKAVGSDIL